MPRKTTHIRFKGSKRKRIRIGIVRAPQYPLDRISLQLHIWIANSMEDTIDVRPVIAIPVIPGIDGSLAAVAKENDCFTLRDSNQYDFLWAFWDGRSQAVLDEMRRATKLGRRVVVFPL